MVAFTPAPWAITINVARSENDLVAAVNLVLASGCPYRMTSNHGGNPVTGLNALPVITTPAIVRGPAILTT